MSGRRSLSRAHGYDDHEVTGFTLSPITRSRGSPNLHIDCDDQSRNLRGVSPHRTGSWPLSIKQRDIVSHSEMCQAEQRNLQQGMNFRPGGRRSVSS